MPKGSCKRYYYTPLLGTLEMSCNHIKPYNDKIRAAREWYDFLRSNPNSEKYVGLHHPWLKDHFEGGSSLDSFFE